MSMRVYDGYEERAPRDFYIAGSNDDSSYDILGTIVDQNYDDLATSDSQVFNWHFANATAYRYIKFFIKTVQSGSILRIADVRYYEGTAQGNTGAQGATAAAGAQGDQGAAGSGGSAGAQGNQGATGTGNQGNQGATAAAGAQGNQGASGGGGGGGGIILQVLNNSNQPGAVTNTAFATAATQAITPASTGNKVLLTAAFNFKLSYDDFNYEDGDIRWRLYRGTTALGTEQIFINTTDMSGIDKYFGGAFTFLDSPSTTSAITYNLKYKGVGTSPSATITDTMLTVMEVD